MTDPKASKDARSIFSNAIRAIIADFKVEAGSKLVKDLLPRMQKGLKISNLDV